MAAETAIPHAEAVVRVVWWIAGGLGGIIAGLLAIIAKFMWGGFEGLKQALERLGDRVESGFRRGEERMGKHESEIAALRATCEERKDLCGRFVERSGQDRRQS